MMRALILVVTLVLAPLAQALEVPCWEVLLTSKDRFLAHTENHIRRVTILGLELHKHYPQDFPGVDSALLAEFLLLHDQSKVNRTAPFLRQHGLHTRSEYIIDTLFRFSGNWQNLPEGERTALRDLMNRVDHAVALSFFRRNGLLSADGSLKPAALQYLRLEKLADSVDTVLSVARGEEFGRFPRIGLKNMYVNEPRDWIYIRYLARYYRKRVADADDHLFLSREGYEI